MPSPFKGTQNSFFYPLISSKGKWKFTSSVSHSQKKRKALIQNFFSRKSPQKQVWGRQWEHSIHMHFTQPELIASVSKNETFFLKTWIPPQYKENKNLLCSMICIDLCHSKNLSPYRLLITYQWNEKMLSCCSRKVNVLWKRVYLHLMCKL